MDPTSNVDASATNTMGSSDMNSSFGDVYELQLTMLQEQLVQTMIDNETMKAELTELKTKNNVENILKELEFERDKSKQLARQLKQATSKKYESQSIEDQPLHQNAESIETDEAFDDATDEVDHSPSSFVPSSKVSTVDAASRTKRQRLQYYLASVLYELLADFTHEADPEPEHCHDDDPLTVKQLKENILRFKSSASHVFRVCKGFYNLMTWRYPLATVFAFSVYMYSVWHGWLLSVLLLLAIFNLSLNYLISRGWHLNVHFLTEPDCDSDKDANSPDRALSDRFLLVINVAQQVQNTLGDLADRLEKIKNLLMWQEPEATRELMFMLCVLLSLSCLMSGNSLFTLIGVYAGIKMFLVEYLYAKFPRFKQRHDSTYKMWKRLPTDAELLERSKLARIDRHIISKQRCGSSSSSGDEAAMEPELSDEDRNFCAVFSLPLTERPLHDRENGWRVTLVDKSKAFLKSINRNGRLYVTNSFLCLERYKTPSPKNLMIPLKDITRLEKTKPFSWLPGAGMSLEISVEGFEQPYTFGAIINRDECFDCLVAYGKELHLPWAMIHAKRPTTNDSVDSKDTISGSMNPTYRFSDLRDSNDYDDLTKFGE